MQGKVQGGEVIPALFFSCACEFTWESYGPFTSNRARVVCGMKVRAVARQRAPTGRASRVHCGNFSTCRQQLAWRSRSDFKQLLVLAWSRVLVSSVSASALKSRLDSSDVTMHLAFLGRDDAESHRPTCPIS